MESEKKPLPKMTDQEIARLFWEGLSIDALANRVVLTKECGKRKAKERVEQVLYDAQMKESERARSERARHESQTG